MSNVMIVLAMHGAPPKDFPRDEMAELFGLHARLEHADGPIQAVLQHRQAELENRMRLWPRTARNDPFYAGSQELAVHLGEVTGCKVIVGFNEFCAPSVDLALDYAAAQAPEKIIVITPMLTQGGEHAEVDIPNAIRRARQRHPHILMAYAWPFEVSDVARFLAAQMTHFVDEGAFHQPALATLP
jgi:sirohydrochlorin cobaltochelatase